MVRGKGGVISGHGQVLEQVRGERHGRFRLSQASAAERVGMQSVYRKVMRNNVQESNTLAGHGLLPGAITATTIYLVFNLRLYHMSALKAWSTVVCPLPGVERGSKELEGSSEVPGVSVGLLSLTSMIRSRGR